MKNIHILGGGTFSHVRNHLALAAPAFGGTARQLYDMFEDVLYDAGDSRDLCIHLTKMADRESDLVTNEDVAKLVDVLIADPNTSVIVFNAALCDYDGHVHQTPGEKPPTQSGPHADRLKTSEGGKTLYLTPAEKIIGRIRKTRKDIFVVGFKTTTGATRDEQYLAALNLLKANSINLVLANDTVTRVNMIVTPEESRYFEIAETKEEPGMYREGVLKMLVEMTVSRSKLRFTRSVIVGGEDDLVPWKDERVPDNLRAVVDYMVAKGAYKPFRGSTAGHFAVKIGDGQFLTSKRKTNFNKDLRLVQVETNGPDQVIAHGAHPSVGGQSQRAVFEMHPDVDCIVHAHIPKRGGDPEGTHNVNVRPQWALECGSTECGINTANGLVTYDEDGYRIKAVMLDNHGPNIVFNRDVPAEAVIDFIERNFDLSQKTGGPVSLGEG